MDEARKQMLIKASRNPKTREKVRAILANRNILTASQRIDLAEAVSLSKESEKVAAGPISIDKMPGFSPMQLRAHIDKLGKIQREIAIMEERFRTELAEIKGLEKEESAGLALLKEAASKMAEKDKFIVEAQRAILQFTAYAQKKTPGIEQMIAKPDNVEWGEKAGDLFGRIGAKLGEEIATAVADIYRQCEEDLTHVAGAVRGLKIVQKTSSLPEGVVKMAGIADVLVGVREWLAGKTNSVAQRILNFAGDLSRWVKGFIVRTDMVKKDTKTIVDACKEAKTATEKMFA